MIVVNIRGYELIASELCNAVVFVVVITDNLPLRIRRMSYHDSGRQPE